MSTMPKASVSKARQRRPQAASSNCYCGGGGAPGLTAGGRADAPVSPWRLAEELQAHEAAGTMQSPLYVQLCRVTVQCAEAQ